MAGACVIEDPWKLEMWYIPKVYYLIHRYADVLVCCKGQK